jgi:hypothetical protein
LLEEHTELYQFPFLEAEPAYGPASGAAGHWREGRGRAALTISSHAQRGPMVKNITLSFIVA